MEPRPNIVMVTGGTGHVGALVIHQLLKDGYSVRAPARPPKVEALKRTHPDAKGKLEIFEMADLVSDAGKWPEILQGVDAVIHAACPIHHPGVTSADVYSGAIDGTQKLLDAVAQSSVKRFILTGSLGVFFQPDCSTLLDKDAVYNHDTWSTIDHIDPNKHEPSYTYITSKINSEKLIWQAAEKYPHIDFTSILPSTIYGWCLKDYPVPKTLPECNANKFLYELIQKDLSFPVYPLRDVVHNRDVARAHVLALTVPALPNKQKKRFIVSSETMSWVEAIEFLKEPETVAKFKERGLDIIARLPADSSGPGIQSLFGLDASLTENVLGMKKNDYITWKEILLEVMPNLMDWEKAHPEAL
ncbi:hypothetical protein B0H17DRAFT_1124633 [Mycena rosella]|uniref:NAD-dependent epimerase/dehydratase domain-containing protein n=1 Tax=Mycena rosella TaxID=1033263 RepID=A0AAD7GZK6_MYCRO|nr:hypothetical protein B0H17DRAFT_1124633 [Mycena rosella]